MPGYLLLLKYRRELDIRRFAQAAGEQSNLVQMVTAMQEIKLNNCETQKRWQWERIQVKLFKISVEKVGFGASTTSRFCIFQSDHEYYNLVYCGKGGGGRGDDTGYDDVSDLYHRSAQCAGLFFYRICAACFRTPR